MKLRLLSVFDEVWLGFINCIVIVNPLKARDVKWLHLAIQVKPTFLISDIRALWC